MIPSEWHKWLAELCTKHNCHFLDQNVDGLLRKAGCTNVYQIHGNIEVDRKRMIAGKEYTLPDVVLFGDPIKWIGYEAFDEAFYNSETTDLSNTYLIFIGSSIQFNYIFDLLGTECTKVQVNIEDKYDEYFNVNFTDIKDFKEYIENLEKE